MAGIDRTVPFNPFAGFYPASPGPQPGFIHVAMKPWWWQAGSTFRRVSWPAVEDQCAAVPVATVTKSGGGWLLRTADSDVQTRLVGADLATVLADAEARHVSPAHGVLDWVDAWLCAGMPVMLPGQVWLEHVHKLYGGEVGFYRHRVTQPHMIVPGVPSAARVCTNATMAALLWGPGGPWMDSRYRIDLTDARTDPDRDDSGAEE